MPGRSSSVGSAAVVSRFHRRPPGTLSRSPRIDGRAVDRGSWGAMLTRACCLAVALAFPLAVAASGCRQAPATAEKVPEPYAPGLGEIMTLQQMRHVKLWFAGQAANW